MKCLQTGRIKAAALLMAAWAMCSCDGEDSGGEPVLYTVRNMSSSEYLAFAWHVYSEEEDSRYITRGETSEISIKGDGGIGQNPDMVWVTISARDSVVEVVPRLMTDGTSYSMFVGIDGWRLNDFGPGYLLDITDEVLGGVAGRMRGKGVPPFRIVRDEIVNKLSEEVTVSFLSGGSVVSTRSIGAGDTAVFAGAGEVLGCEEVEFRAGSWAFTAGVGDVVGTLRSKSKRIDGGSTGYRQFYITEYEFGMLKASVARGS